MTTHRRPVVAAVAGAFAVLFLLSGCSASPETPAPSADSLVVSGCPRGTGVSTADELSAALENARPGDTIVLADGRYAGEFTATAVATEAQPVVLCGSAGAVLDGGSVDSGYTLHLDRAEHWRLEGFTVSGGQKGVMLDGASHNVLSGLTVSAVGDEAVHLRAGSSDNLLEGITVTGTGLRDPEFGEGIYIGTAESNWCDISDCEPDRSDRNRIVGATVSGTTAETVDVKEGTTGGELTGSILDGSAISAVDSLVDVKGNDWAITGNTGTAAPEDGAQVHVILEGWGRDNDFAGNTFAVAGAGVAIAIVGDARDSGNVVHCDNTATVDGRPATSTASLSNVACTG